MRWFWLLLLPSVLWGRFLVTDDLCQRVMIGPEGYYFERDRAGGTHQDGLMWGFRAQYDRLRGNGFYFGGEGSWARGNLKGNTASGRKLDSRMIVGEAEGRLGWTFQWRRGWRPSVTPMVGVGYISHVNHFAPPSPLPVTVRNTWGYGMVGFFSNMCWGTWSGGLNVRVGFMYEARSKVSNDPFIPDVTIQIEDKIQYAVDVPITRHIWAHGCWWELKFVPFWRYRHLGGRENFPFDFADTVYQMWGARVMVAARF